MMISLPVVQQYLLFVCVEVLWPSQPIGVISLSSARLPDHTFTEQA